MTKKIGQVDVLVQCCNQEKSIAKCLQSILAQNYKQVVVTILDDSSTDDTPNIAREFADRYPGKVLFFQTPYRAGSAQAARKLRTFSPEGEFWSVLDGDDWWVGEGRLDLMVKALQANRSAIGVGGRTALFDSADKVLDIVGSSREVWDFVDWLAGAPLLYVHLSALLFRNEFTGSDGFSPVLLDKGWPAGEWHRTLATLAESRKKLISVPDVVSGYRWGSGVWSSLEAAERERINFDYDQKMRALGTVRARLSLYLRCVGLQWLGVQVWRGFFIGSNFWKN